jgi:hypothetical protein
MPYPPKSSNGSSFTHLTDGNGNRRVILTYDIAGAPNGSWFGYTTPSAFRSADGWIHLFYSLLVAPGGPSSARIVTVQTAKSSDGVLFTEDPNKILEAGQGNWMDQNVRSPTVIESNGGFYMWFAGETQTPFYNSGIGYSLYKCQ